jgi:hypothetical protein
MLKNVHILTWSWSIHILYLSLYKYKHYDNSHRTTRNF